MRSLLLVVVLFVVQKCRAACSSYLQSGDFSCNTSSHPTARIIIGAIAAIVVLSVVVGCTRRYRRSNATSAFLHAIPANRKPHTIAVPPRRQSHRLPQPQPLLPMAVPHEVAHSPYSPNSPESNYFAPQSMGAAYSPHTSSGANPLLPYQTPPSTQQSFNSSISTSPLLRVTSTSPGNSTQSANNIFMPVPQVPSLSTQPRQSPAARLNPEPVGLALTGSTSLYRPPAGPPPTENNRNEASPPSSASNDNTVTPQHTGATNFADAPPPSYSEVVEL